MVNLPFVLVGNMIRALSNSENGRFTISLWPEIIRLIPFVMVMCLINNKWFHCYLPLSRLFEEFVWQLVFVNLNVPT